MLPWQMPDSKECPLCGSTMRLKHRSAVDRIPGHAQTTTRTIAEWTCPDCDYFEEVGKDDA